MADIKEAKEDEKQGQEQQEEPKEQEEPEEQEKPEEQEEQDVELTSPPIVLDNGGGLLKSGLCTSARPYVLPSLVGYPKHLRVMLSSASTDKYFGNLAYKYRGLCRLKYPINSGIINNWNDIIQLWQHLYNNILQVNATDHPILITEVPKNPISNRIRMTQIYLEYFNTPSIYFISPNILSLYATGRLSGCVFDSGFGVTSCVPVIDGYSIPNAITRMDIGGYNITKYLSKILTKYGDYNFKTSSELQTVRIIKEKECILSNASVDTMINPAYHSTGIMGINTATNGNLLSNKLSSLSGKLGSSFQTLGLSKSASTGSKSDNSPQYTLPDGTILNIGNTHERAAEILFHPELIGYTKCRGIQYLLLNCIQKCDVKQRNKLYDSIYLTGGNCNIKNFGQRLVNELKKKVYDKKNHKNIKIKSHVVTKSNEKHLIPFIGGTLLASNSLFQQLAITKEQFNEYGASVLFRRSLC